MKKILLSSVAVLAALTASAQAYTGKPYTGTAIAFPKTLTSSTELVGVFNDDTKVVRASAFDKKDDVASFATDEGVTCFLNPAIPTDPNVATSFFTVPADYVRDCVEKANTANAATSGTTANIVYKWNGVPDAFEKADKAKFHYTVNFTKAGTYTFYLRTRGGAGNEYIISLLDKTDMAKVVAVLNLNTAGLSGASTAGTASTDATCKMIGIAKTGSNPTTQASSFWYVRSLVITIANAGEYVLMVNQNGGGTGSSFAGFTFLEGNTTTSISKTSNNDASLIFDGKNIQASVVGAATLKVYDLSGRQVATYAVDGSINQYLGLNAGVYVVALSSANETKTIKVVVK